MNKKYGCSSFECWNLFPLHMEFLLVGWLIQLAMGVAFWIIPRFSSGSSHGPLGLVWLSFALLNTGILITVLQSWFPVAVLIGRIAEVVAGILFVAGSWRRIKPHGVMQQHRMQHKI
ncbi:MAG: cbb3-type cytochrome c oxidase subunit I [Chloroflexi bacterium]|nr:cbb3-type cytochrome c oxidase subunit I [Chloroflexota bacterium]